MAFSGIMETATIEEDVGTSKISLTVGNALMRMNQTKEMLWTHETQKDLFPGDKGCEHMSDIQDDTEGL